MSCNNPVYNEYFSDNNYIRIQEDIVKRVKKMMGIKIPYQKRESVYIMMRYIFNNYAKNNQQDIGNQVSELNLLCVNLTSKNIIGNIEQYIGYMKDIDENAEKNLLSYPEHTSKSKQNKSFDFSV